MSAKEVREEIGADILIAMAANEEFPVGSAHRLAKTMQEYFVSEGFSDVLVDHGYSWRPDADYWPRHLKGIRRALRDRKLFLEYVRGNDEGTFIGSWQFVRKGAFQEVMNRARADIITRAETYNDINGAGHEKWKLDTPYVQTAEIAAK